MTADGGKNPPRRVVTTGIPGPVELKTVLDHELSPGCGHCAESEIGTPIGVGLIGKTGSGLAGLSGAFGSRAVKCEETMLQNWPKLSNKDFRSAGALITEVVVVDIVKKA